MDRLRRSSRFALVLLAFLGAGLSELRAQTLEDIIARNLEAKGGVDALRATTSTRMRGTIRLHQPPPSEGPIVLQMTVSVKRPNKVRRDMTLKGETRTVAFDGATAWQSTPSGPVEMQGLQADAIRSEGEFDSVLLTYRDQGHRIVLEGTETLDGRRVHRLRVTRREGPIQTYYLDAETYLEQKVATEIELGGQRIRSEMILGDYRTVEGRTVPFRARQLVNGALAADIEFAQIEFNVPLDDSLFRMEGK